MSMGKPWEKIRGFEVWTIQVERDRFSSTSSQKFSNPNLYGRSWKSWLFWKDQLQGCRYKAKPLVKHQYLDPAWYHLWRIVSENVSGTNLQPWTWNLIKREKIHEWSWKGHDGSECFPALWHDFAIILQFESWEVQLLRSFRYLQLRTSGCCTGGASSRALAWTSPSSPSPSPASSSKPLPLGKNAPALPRSDPWASRRKWRCHSTNVAPSMPLLFDPCSHLTPAYGTFGSNTGSADKVLTAFTSRCKPCSSWSRKASASAAAFSVK